MTLPLYMVVVGGSNPRLYIYPDDISAFTRAKYINGAENLPTTVYIWGEEFSVNTLVM